MFVIDGFGVCNHSQFNRVREIRGGGGGRDQAVREESGRDEKQQIYEEMEM